MNRQMWDLARLFVIAMGSAALFGMFTATAADSPQGIGAQAGTVKPDPTRDINTLRQQVLALERRVAELEKEELEKFKGDDVNDDAREKKLEQRLAQLEKAQETTKSDRKAGDKPDPSNDDEPMTVRAPFVVQDKAGRTIFRVDTIEDGRPLAVFGNPLGASAAIGIDPRGNASLRLFDSRRSAAVQLSAKEEGGDLVLTTPKSREALTLSVDQDGAGRVRVFNAAGRAVTGLTSDAAGGRVLVVDGKSGMNTVTLSTTAEGGRVSVYAPQGGSPRALVLADGNSGSVSVLNSSGTGAASFETGAGGAGRLVIADATGNIMVEAGTLNTGVGIVRAGPGGFGPAGVVGGTVSPASSIQGRK